MNVRRIRTLSSSRPSDISVWLGGGKRHGAKIVARLELVMRFSVHLREPYKKSSIHCFGSATSHLLLSKAPILKKNTVNKVNRGPHYTALLCVLNIELMFNSINLILNQTCCRLLRGN